MKNARPEISPFYLIDNKIIPVLTYCIKVVYDVVSPGNQPLKYIELICVPNGMPFFVSPNYNLSFSGILTPGKDEVYVERKRTRIKLNPLSLIADWRCQKIYINNSGSVRVSKRR
ncbi:BglI family type II restriction endonuclease [Brenneria izbisi]|uniref:BglI family type II restriction endonuclease n=1 Tax=Brenneria izbisi TaxID=2939450 RepID=A0AA41Y078_9GAMM|nr:BglI family type II restriction endonuclease [Brenneria izbisi]MCV9880136.1 BglI family type II restriction endonuclease [Brenneria izbisi]MCV9883588.1 BglI family type II restriction endonuclease [Brenneria izbisi]